MIVTGADHGGVELKMALEEEYDMEISDEEAEKIRTVKDVVNYIESHK